MMLVVLVVCIVTLAPKLASEAKIPSFDEGIFVLFV
jgi:hypothetical protein